MIRLTVYEHIAVVIRGPRGQATHGRGAEHWGGQGWREKNECEEQVLERANHVLEEYASRREQAEYAVGDREWRVRRKTQMCSVRCEEWEG